MSIVYAESSAVLRWLLGADAADSIRSELADAEAVVSSTVTSAEVTRTLCRLVASGDIDVATHDRARARYDAALAHWHVYGLSEAVLTRVGQPFPVEPVRTLDAIHLATAWLFTRDVTPAVILSVDQRIRSNAGALGLHVSPAGT